MQLVGVLNEENIDCFIVASSSGSDSSSMVVEYAVATTVRYNKYVHYYYLLSY